MWKIPTANVFPHERAEMFFFLTQRAHYPLFTPVFCIWKWDKAVFVTLGRIQRAHKLQLLPCNIDAFSFISASYLWPPIHVSLKYIFKNIVFHPSETSSKTIYQFKPAKSIWLSQTLDSDVFFFGHCPILSAWVSMSNIHTACWWFQECTSESKSAAELPCREDNCVWQRYGQQRRQTSKSWIDAAEIRRVIPCWVSLPIPQGHRPAFKW